jgi:formate dehydrogenase maturation protein FdhE
MSDVTGLGPGSIVGEAVKMPFAVLPHPAALFIRRSKRLAALAPAHDLAPFLGLPTKLTAKAEAWCRSFMKVRYQVNDHALAALANDMATLGRDMLMAYAGRQRRGQNSFLLGY